jgi:O-acetyl-ADP-ribose deacetylase (regulator of RNase III)
MSKTQRLAQNSVKSSSSLPDTPAFVEESVSVSEYEEKMLGELWCDDVWDSIVGFMPAVQLAALVAVNRRFNVFVSNSCALWMRNCEIDFGASYGRACEMVLAYTWGSSRPPPSISFDVYRELAGARARMKARIRCVQGDVRHAKDFGVDTVVCPAVRSLHPYGPAARALHQAAGPHLLSYIQANLNLAASSGPLLVDGPFLEIAESVSTPSFDLGLKGIVHAVGPTSHTPHAMAMLQTTYAKAFKLAAELGGTKIGVVSIGTGGNGLHLEASAWVAVSEMMAAIAVHGFEEVVMIAYDPAVLEAFNSAKQRLCRRVAEEAVVELPIIVRAHTVLLPYMTVHTARAPAPALSQPSSADGEDETGACTVEDETGACTVGVISKSTVHAHNVWRHGVEATTADLVSIDSTIAEVHAHAIGAIDTHTPGGTAGAGALCAGPTARIFELASAAWLQQAGVSGEATMRHAAVYWCEELGPTTSAISIAERIVGPLCHHPFSLCHPASNSSSDSGSSKSNNSGSSGSSGDSGKGDQRRGRVNSPSCDSLLRRWVQLAAAREERLFNGMCQDQPTSSPSAQRHRAEEDVGISESSPIYTMHSSDSQGSCYQQSLPSMIKDLFPLPPLLHRAFVGRGPMPCPSMHPCRFAFWLTAVLGATASQSGGSWDARASAATGTGGGGGGGGSHTAPLEHCLVVMQREVLEAGAFLPDRTTAGEARLLKVVEGMEGAIACLTKLQEVEEAKQRAAPFIERQQRKNVRQVLRQQWQLTAGSVDVDPALSSAAAEERGRVGGGKSPGDEGAGSSRQTTQTPTRRRSSSRVSYGQMLPSHVAQSTEPRDEHQQSSGS